MPPTIKRIGSLREDALNLKLPAHNTWYKSANSGVVHN